jgi:sugar lactone lactonase YvrE
MERVIGISLVSDSASLLAESPVWDTGNCLWWIDVVGQSLHRYNLETRRRFDGSLDEQVGSIGLRQGGGLVAATRTGWRLAG